MASSRIYLSGAAKRKQRQIRNQNEAKSRRTLEDLNWYSKIQRNNKSQSEGVEISSDEVVCEDDTRDTDNDNTTHTTTDLDERIASQETGVTIGETISFQVRSSDAERIISPSLSNDPSSWKNLTEQDKEYIVKIGPPKNPKSFPRDSSGRNFPQNIFFQEMTNGERVTRDWLVWSISRQSLFCFPCCLFQEISQKEVTSKTSKLTKPDLGHGDNWRKLYGKVEAHQRSSSHVSCFITWKELAKTVLRTTGIDQQLQLQFESEVSKWREIFRCILDVVLFLSERQLPFRGSTTELNNPNNGLFLGNLELLSGHNKILKSHLDEVKKHQETTAECKRIISRHVHKTNLLMNALKLFSMLLWKKLSKHCTIASLLTVPRTFSTQNK